jgi:hypothetical protein
MSLGLDPGVAGHFADPGVVVLDERRERFR